MKPTDDPKELEMRTRALITRGVLKEPAGQQRPARVTSLAERFVRDPDVKAWVTLVADGFCENCELPAPFVQADGMPFLEVHRVKSLERVMVFSANKGSLSARRGIFRWGLAPTARRKFRSELLLTFTNFSQTHFGG